MILGMSISTFTTLHVVISLIGIFSGAIALFGMIGSGISGSWTALFLLTTILTSATGFPIPPLAFDPPRVAGVISLIALATALLAFYGKSLTGAWRRIYVICAVLALYLNVFVAVVQAFQKLPFLQPLAPTQSESPFLVAQVLVLVMFVKLGIAAAKRFHPDVSAAA